MFDQQRSVFLVVQDSRLLSRIILWRNTRDKNTSRRESCTTKKTRGRFASCRSAQLFVALAGDADYNQATQGKGAGMTPLDGLKAAMATVDAYYKERGIFQDRFGFGVCPALVVIDMAYGWTDPDYAGGSARLDPAIDAIRQLLPAARAKNVPIYYTTSDYDEKPSDLAACRPQSRASRRPQFKSAADFSPKFRKWDRRAGEIDERVKPEPGELVIFKEHASAFAGTPLIGHLIAHRVDTLLITGCSTSACVRATATDAKSNYFKPIIIREAVQDRSEVAHEWTLFDIQARFADVVSTEETLKYLSALQ
jgi:nicotinamidase-related amidase